MTIEEMKVVVAKCAHPEYTFTVIQDARGAIYLQGSYDEPDTDTGVRATQVTRRWFLNPVMVKSEIVQTVFKCLMTSMEHRAREWFRYRGEPVFGPHFDVDDLHEICRQGKFERREV